ncbi:MAG: hypothetical protein IPG00_03080 [Saprospiraceae bacterium]|nr:hypothetical protein [Saprospiraceae bacterium]
MPNSQKVAQRKSFGLLPDLSGNTATCSLEITVNDNRNPILLAHHFGVMAFNNQCYAAM